MGYNGSILDKKLMENKYWKDFKLDSHNGNTNLIWIDQKRFRYGISMALEN